MLSITDLLPILSLQNNKEFLYSLEKKIDKTFRYQVVDTTKDQHNLQA